MKRIEDEIFAKIYEVDEDTKREPPTPQSPQKEPTI